MQALMADATNTATLIKREDYAAPAFWIESVALSFDLDPTKTRVLNKMRLRRNPDVAQQALRLKGEDLTLTRVMVNGQGSSFKIDNGELVLESLPEGFEAFDLELLTMCNPEKNTQLMGLYMSSQTFFTQCEAQGFRRITYFLDRPDVMATYEVTLRANKAAFPVLLANGNLVESGDLPDGRHFARWQDPHPKPSYLFALVAGNLVCREQRITARSGQSHLLQIYVRPGDLDKTEHAMNALMASIMWDESRFNLPLELGDAAVLLRDRRAVQGRDARDAVVNRELVQRCLVGEVRRTLFIDLTERVLLGLPGNAGERLVVRGGRLPVGVRGLLIHLRAEKRLPVAPGDRIKRSA